MRFSSACAALLGAMVSLLVSDSHAILISELEPNPPGNDPPAGFVELSGPPGELFTGWLVLFESDPVNSAGEVNNKYGVNGAFDAKGLLLVPVGNFENPAFTAALVENNPANGIDIDPNNDGMVDDSVVGTLGVIYDAIGVQKGTNQNPLLYGEQLGGEDFVRITPGGDPTLIFRDKSKFDWYAVTTGTDVLFDPEVKNITDGPCPLEDFAPGPDPLLPTFGLINPTKKKTPPCNPTVCQACHYYCGYHYMCEAVGEHKKGQSCEVDPWCAFCSRVCPKDAVSNDDCPGGCLSNPDDFICPTPTPMGSVRKLGFLAGGMISS